MLHWVKNTNKCHAVNWGPWKDAGMATEKVLISFAEFANRIVDNMSWPLLIVGHLAPVLLALAAWFQAADTSALLATAGFLVIAGGTFWKCGLILKASYQNGFTLSRLPQRGSGTRAAPSLVA